jgi:hypothetical protein
MTSAAAPASTSRFQRVVASSLLTTTVGVLSLGVTAGWGQLLWIAAMVWVSEKRLSAWPKNLLLTVSVLLSGVILWTLGHLPPYRLKIAPVIALVVLMKGALELWRTRRQTTNVR